MSVSVFEHGWLKSLFGDDEVAAPFALNQLKAHVMAFEVALTRALGQSGAIDPEAVARIVDKCQTFTFKDSAISEATERDGVPVPEIVRQLKAHVGEPDARFVHLGATSQDVVDTALVLTLGVVNGMLEARFRAVVDALEWLISDHGTNPLMGRTRMRAALPITVADRVVTWRDPLVRHLDRLNDIRPRLMVLQFGGAVGTRDRLGDKGDAVARAIADDLGLGHADKCWHAMRDGLADYASWLSLVTGSIGKMGADVALMAQGGIDEIALSGGGTSSAMPHKQNPVKAELLVALARFNAVQLSGMHHALIHEQERSGAAWSLEWMILPQMVVATGAALKTATALISSIERIGAPDAQS